MLATAYPSSYTFCAMNRLLAGTLVASGTVDDAAPSMDAGRDASTPADGSGSGS
jgi:hypothetical protein